MILLLNSFYVTRDELNKLSSRNLTLCLVFSHFAKLNSVKCRVFIFFEGKIVAHFNDFIRRVVKLSKLKQMLEVSSIRTFHDVTSLHPFLIAIL